MLFAQEWQYFPPLFVQYLAAMRGEKSQRVMVKQILYLAIQEK